jgi:hypothetical protein
MTAMRFVEKRRNEVFSDVEMPDEMERERQAVDLAFQSTYGKFVMEHTQIESFPEQILDGIRLINILSPLEARLQNTLPVPGHYQLAIEVGALKRVKDAERLRQFLTDWIIKTAPLLKTHPISDRCIKETPPGVPFPVLLCRYPGLDGRFILCRYSPKELEKERRVRLDKAINDKCPKLHGAKGEATSILVLESDDIALANHDLIAEAVKDQFREEDLLPDEIYLVETEEEPWLITVLKEGAEWFPKVSNAGPHKAEANPSDRRKS